MRGWLDARAAAVARERDDADHDHDHHGEEAAPLGPAPAPGKLSLGGGAALPEAVRRRMEAAFSTSFASVRVSEGAQAEELGAEAFAVGEHIQFAPGRLDFQSKSGLELLGHELAHVVQQRQGRAAMAPGKLAPINADAALEAEADRAGELAAAGETISIGGGGSGGGPGAAAPATGPLQLKGRRGRQRPKPGPAEPPYGNRIVGENPFEVLRDLDDEELRREEEERQRRRQEARRRNRERQLAQNEEARQRREEEERLRQQQEQLMAQQARERREAEAREQQQQEEEAQRKREEAERKRKEAEEAKRKEEEERKRKEDEERTRREEEERKRQEEEEAKRKEEEERRRKEEEEAKRKEEEERKRKEEEEAKRKEEEERKRKEEEERRKEMVCVPAGSILTSPVNVPGTFLPVGTPVNEALYLPKGTRVSFISFTIFNLVRQTTWSICQLPVEQHENLLRTRLSGGQIASYLPLAQPMELGLFANCMSMFQLSSCLTASHASLLGPYVQSPYALQSYLQLNGALFVPHCQDQVLQAYLFDHHLDPAQLLPLLDAQQLARILPRCARQLIPRLQPAQITLLLTNGCAGVIIEHLTQPSCTGISGVTLSLLAPFLRRKPQLLLWLTFEQLMMFDMQVLAIELPCITYLTVFGQMEDPCFSLISHLLTDPQLQQIRRRNGASKSVKANLQARCISCCKRLRLTGKVLDVDDRNGLPAREQEIEQGQKLAAHLQELELLLEAAEQGDVLCVQVGLHTLGKIAFLLGQLGLAGLQELVNGKKTKENGQITYGGDGVVWRSDGPTTIQAKGNSSNNPLSSQTWTTHEGAIKRGTVPFEDQLGEAANQLAGLVAHGDHYGYENPIPGVVGGVVHLQLTGVAHPGDLSPYLEAAQRALARQLNKKMGPAWTHVHEIRITWQGGRTSRLISNNDGTYREG